MNFIKENHSCGGKCYCIVDDPKAGIVALEFNDAIKRGANQGQKPLSDEAQARLKLEFKQLAALVETLNSGSVEDGVALIKQYYTECTYHDQCLEGSFAKRILSDSNLQDMLLNLNSASIGDFGDH